MTLTIEGGTLRAIYSDELAELLAEGESQTVRASHVEPAPDGGWFADMAPSGGPVLSGFATRGEALQAEVAWLQTNRNL